MATLPPSKVATCKRVILIIPKSAISLTRPPSVATLPCAGHCQGGAPEGPGRGADLCRTRQKAQKRLWDSLEGPRPFQPARRHPRATPWPILPPFYGSAKVTNLLRFKGK